MGHSMDSQPGIVTGQTLPRAVQAKCFGAAHAPRTTPTTILLVAIWIGLTAGFLDLALLIMRIVCSRAIFIAWATISGGLSRRG